MSQGQAACDVSLVMGQGRWHLSWVCLWDLAGDQNETAGGVRDPGTSWELKPLLWLNK